MQVSCSAENLRLLCCEEKKMLMNYLGLLAAADKMHYLEPITFV
jgi:hypothetical protein